MSRNTTPAPEGLFTDYYRMRREEKSVTTITEDNIGTLAAWLRVSVDYSTSTPALLIPETVHSVEDGEPSTRLERYKVGERIRRNYGNLAGISRDYTSSADQRWIEVAS